MAVAGTKGYATAKQREEELHYTQSAFIDYCCFFSSCPHTFFRNAGNAVLHPLLSVADDRAQNGHEQIFRSGHFRRHWAQRHHYGHGVLHDAAGKFG